MRLELLYDPTIIFWFFVYLIALFTSIRVIMDTRSPTKTSAYILLILLLPIIGTIVYFTFGVNYRKARLYGRNLSDELFEGIRKKIVSESIEIVEENRQMIGKHFDLIKLLIADDTYNKVSRNKVRLLKNGEQKFPEVLRCLQEARHHIHIEYYIFENDSVGNAIKDILIAKAKEGVTVRLIYDALGSFGFRKNVKVELEKNNVLVKPFSQVRFPTLASRINYRDHRKILIIDGKTGFTGGINISSRYVNDGNHSLYWRDTHIKIEGEAVHSMQYHFLTSWFFCSGERLPFSNALFPTPLPIRQDDPLVQIVCSGPDFKRSSIMLAYFTAISMAEKRVYICTPYFIPNESLLTAIKKAALSGKDVRLLVPYDSDSWLVNAASRFYFTEIMEAGVRVFRYKRGFIHSKTMVVDDYVSFVGTANMDFRSFEMNFEVNAILYGFEPNNQLAAAFSDDLDDADELDLIRWSKRNKYRVFIDSFARILAPLL